MPRPLTITATGAVEAGSATAITGANGGYIANDGGLIEGNIGILHPQGQHDHFVNSGTIDGTGTLASTAGVILVAGSVDNAGLIEGYQGIEIGTKLPPTPAAVTNSGDDRPQPRLHWDHLASVSSFAAAAASPIWAAGALIYGGSYGIEVYKLGGQHNEFGGTIRSSSGSGVLFQSSGGSVDSVSNAAGGYIVGAQSGVEVFGGPGTVTNSGTIIGTDNDGVDLWVPRQRRQQCGRPNKRLRRRVFAPDRNGDQFRDDRRHRDQRGWVHQPLRGRHDRHFPARSPEPAAPRSALAESAAIFWS